MPTLRTVITDNLLAVWKEYQDAVDDAPDDPAPKQRLGSWMSEYGPEIVEEIERLRPLMQDADTLARIGGAAARVYRAVEAHPHFELSFSVGKELALLHRTIGQLDHRQFERLLQQDQDD